MAIDELFEPITLIKYKIGEVPYSATGFFYASGGTSYLVTNRHIFEHEHNVSPDEFYIQVRDGDEPDSAPRREIEIIDDKGNSKWLNHPEYTDADVAALPLPDLKLEQTGNSAYSSSDFILSEAEEVKAGTEGMVAGYPSPIASPIQDRKTSSPVLVNALISSSFGNHFDDAPFFLIDAKTYNGMSGSPVLLRSRRFITSDTDRREATLNIEEPGPKDLLGIHSGPYEVSDELSLNRVWYSKVIEEIVSQ